VLHCDLEKATFISALTVASNRKEIKILPQHFDYESGVKIEILELKSLFGETSVIISDYLSD
jgi:hypothetical protein